LADPTDAPTTDPERQPGAPTADPAHSADLARRRFFRQFAGELVQGAATVVGAAQALQRASADAAGAILDPASVALRADVVPAPPTGFRTPFRESPGVIHLVDQRRLPEVLEEYDCRSAAEVAFAIREMVIRGAPAIGQAAAIGLALTANKVRGAKPYARRATLRGAAGALTRARPTAVNLRWAVDRLMASYEPSATCPRTARPSPTRCGPRPIRSSSRRPRTTGGSRGSGSTRWPSPTTGHCGS
jgi:hypothetical protein